MGADARTLVSVRDLAICRTADGRTVLDGIDLRIRPGEVIGLVGESGSGKTTLGLALLGRIRPGLERVRGHVRLEGEDLFSIPAAELAALRTARLGYVAQNALEAFDPAWRLVRQTTEAAMLHGLMDERMATGAAMALYEAMGLPDPEGLGRRYPHQVSGGQLQRVMLAMATLNAPDLIVFDEPTTALDTSTQETVLEAIRRLLRESGAAALYITHDLALVTRIAQRICVLYRGRIVEDAPAEEIVRRPRHPYTRALWGVTAGMRRSRPVPEHPVLELRGIRAGYGKGPDILHDMSLKLARGRTLAVVGESGSGKTTLGRVIAGLLPPRSGEMLLDGEPLPPRLKDRTQEMRRRIQFLHQSADGALNPSHDVFTILSRPLALFRGLSGAALRRRVEELLEMVELPPDILHGRAARLSGGQKQRLALARALAAEPDVLICDEVTSALDAVLRNGILDLLNRVQVRTGTAILFITHDLAAVRAIADEVIVMHEGRAVEAGSCDDVLKAPQSEHTRRLLAAVPAPAGAGSSRSMPSGQ